MAERKLLVRIVGDASGVQRSFNTATRSTNQFSREFSHASRGVLSGSGVFRALGRSLAFASGGFLVFGSAAAVLRKSVDAAKSAQVAQAQLATQLRNNGKVFSDYRKQITQTVTRLEGLSGFQNDELTAGLTTILRTVPNVGKALRDLGTSADLARAKHISLSQAALIIAKTEAGNTTLLRRQGFQIAKNAKVEQALAVLRQKVAGQARAGTTEQERFGAVLHQTEEIIGAGILPTLNKYLISGTKWLEQLNASGKLQKDVAKGAHDFASALGDAASVAKGIVGVIRAVDRVTGSFKNTLELLVAFKIGSVLTNMAGGIGLIGTQAKTSAERVALLRASLTKLAAIGAVVVAVEVVIHRKQIDNAVKSVQDRITAAQQHSAPVKFLAKGESQIANAPGVKQLLGLFGVKNVTPESLLQPLSKIGQGMDNVSRAATQMGDAVALAGAKAAHGLGLAARSATQSSGQVEKATRQITITAEQRNRFFDNAIARILLRGGLGTIQQQIAALSRADKLIAVRLKVTKDVTRRLNLEDQLLQNQAQIQGLNQQAAADALSKRQNAMQEFIANLQLGVTKADATAGLKDNLVALKALEAGIKAEIREFGRTADLAGQLFDVQQQIASTRRQQVVSKQFRQLGFNAAGDVVTPTVKNLQNQLESLSKRVDTPKLRSELARIRKVLAEGLVPTDIRARIQEMFSTIRDELNKGTHNLTKFKKTSTAALVAGLGLDAATTKALRARLSQVGVGGTVPGRSLAAGGAAGGDIVVHSIVQIGEREVGKAVTRHQQKHTRRNPGQRRGPHAGQ